nr:hydroxysteroid 17-beta dehydrogenase 1 [Trachinotus anak]
MDKKVVLITGCSSGIGLSLAVRLASDPDKTFKDNSPHLHTMMDLCCISERACTGLCHNEEPGQEGASFRVRERPAQGHLGHSPNGRD